MNMLFPGLYNYWLRITSFKYSLVRKKTCMFYVANVITFSVFLELLWKFTLLVSYKLNICWTPRVNQFDIRALSFGGYDRFIPLDKIVFYGYWKTLPPSSLSMLHLNLTLFPLCNGHGCSLYYFYFNILITFCATCVSIISLVAENIYLLDS